jgi:hypothetical protein
MFRIAAITRSICGATLLLAPIFAQTGSWTPVVALSSGGQGWEATAAIDGSGNSVALWDERTTQDQLWSNSRPSGGAWGSVVQVSPALNTTSVFPAVRVTTAGFATAVWTDQNGVWTAMRGPGSSWQGVRLLIPGASNPAFVMNARGDAAIAWTVGGPSSTSSSVMAVLRPAGGHWGAQETVATGVQVIADHAGISENGSVIVTWESYHAVCGRYGCSLSNYVVHASRQNAGTSAWVDSGALLGPDAAPHDARAALNSAGAAMLVAMNSLGVYVSATQGDTGGSWSALKTAVNPQGSTITADVISDDAGQVLLVYELITYPTSQAITATGSINGNTWTSPVVVSGVDKNVGQIYFALAPNGAALIIWLQSGSTPAVRAVIRTNGAGAWSSPASISGPGSFISPEAAAVNTSGDAVVIYSGYDTASVHTEYVTNHQP